MPIAAAPLVAQYPVAYFGTGDLMVTAGKPADEDLKRYLLIYPAEAPGPLGLASEVGREAEELRISGGPGGSTGDRPATLALWFGSVASVDQVLAKSRRYPG
jgi:hypothetical protein